ncbi:MAG: hypothetical protein Q9162_004612 [Coniocarpon cinnabarinum]
MSIEVDWSRLADGFDGQVLADSIRNFIHERFQQVQLPRFIRSVKACSFEFGDVAPQILVKDVCNPLPDFYDSDEEDDSLEDAQQLNMKQESDLPSRPAGERHSSHVDGLHQTNRAQLSQVNTAVAESGRSKELVESPALLTFPRASAAGIPGGTSNMSYFHLPLSAGLSGASTPIAGSASRFGGSLLGHLHQNSASSNGRRSMSPPAATFAAEPHTASERLSSTSPPEDTANDLQIVAHLQYDGNVKLSLTAEVSFDYPMESFVGIPLQLNVTGLTFDGVAVLAYIKSKAHFCFLAPEDADALIGGDLKDSPAEAEADHLERAQERRIEEDEAKTTRKPVGGLFEEIRVESEIGEREKGKQVLKNIGKVEKFVLDQVRRIFETELVYPSFWTFLV